MLGRRKEKEDAGAPLAAATLSSHKRLGELLLEENLITRKQLEEACAIQEAEGGFLGHILVKLGYVTQNAVASCLVKQCKIPHLSLLDYDISMEVLRLVPEDVCRKYHVLPIDKLGRILTLAMVDPLDLDALEEVRRACPDLRIKPILCNWEHFEMVARRVFGRRSDHGGASVSMSSLGLSARAPASAPPPAGNTVAATRSPEAPAPPAPPPEGADAGAPPGAGSDLAAIFRDSVRDAMQEFGKDLNAGVVPATAAGVSAQDLAAVLRSALQEAVGAIVQELRHAEPAKTPAATTAPTAEVQEIAQALRDSVGGAVQEALASMMVQMRAMAAADRADAAKAATLPSPQALSDMLREGVGGAIQEALASMMVQLRAMGVGRDAGADASRDIAEAIRATQAETTARLAAVVETMREALEANRAFQTTQEARMAELTQTAMKSIQQHAQMIEGIAVKEGQMRDLSASAGARARHASVSPFGKTGAPPPPETHTEEDAQVLHALESEAPLETLTFDSFYPGTANAFTFKLSQAVAKNPGGEYNPFFLYGHVGIGKTHLISAVGNAILAQPSGRRVGYVSASHFSRRLSDAMRCGALDAFRENYCHWDVLILDDIQFMGGRVEAQEEFFHIFNVLHQQGRQIIIAGDKAPDRLGMLEQRLVSRFASGIVAELKAPEWETRMEILRHHVKQSGAKVPEEVLSLIAMRVPNDVRKMTGSLRKIVAFARLVGQEMSCEMAGEILSHLGAGEAA